MKLHKVFCATACAAFVVLSQAHAADITIGADTVGGSYYLYAGGLATYLTEKNAALQATARTTRGSVENVRLLDRNQLDFGLANASVVAQQKAGINQFNNAQSDRIRGIAILDLSPTHVITLADSGIKTLMDLRGKRVSIGASGSGGANVARNILQVLGILNDVKIAYLGYDESATNLRDGNLEAIIQGSGLPMPSLVDLTTTRKVRLIPFDRDFIAKLQKEAPAIEVTIIPANTYNGIDYDVTTIGTPSTLVTRDNINEDIAYTVTKTLLSADNHKYMKAIYRAWDPKPGFALWKRVGVPLAPGAEKAYREAGLLK
ncbi:MAG: TAXI family TRAP transporter solute-binding subunit [Acidobacteriota bacterium]